MGAPVRYEIQPCPDIHEEWDWRSSAANQPCRARVSSLAKERSLQHRPDADHSFQPPIAPCAGSLIYRLDLVNTVTDISCQALLSLSWTPLFYVEKLTKTRDDLGITREIWVSLRQSQIYQDAAARERDKRTFSDLYTLRMSWAGCYLLQVKSA